MKKNNKKNSKQDNKDYDILNEIKRFPRLKTDDNFLEELHVKIAALKNQKPESKGMIESMIDFIRHHIFATTFGLGALIVLIYFSINFFSDNSQKNSTDKRTAVIRIDQNKKIIVDLTNYRNTKLIPSPPDTSRAGIPENKPSEVKPVRSRSAANDRITIIPSEKFIAGAAKEADLFRKRIGKMTLEKLEELRRKVGR